LFFIKSNMRNLDFTLNIYLMKNLLLFLVFLASVFNLKAQNSEAGAQKYIDSLENAIVYKRGTVKLSNGVASINVPFGFKFIDSQQATSIVTDVWGNPPTEVLGLLLPENSKVTDSQAIAYVIEYDESGYVEDKDAKDINYTDLLKDMQADEEESNEERKEMGYEAMNLVGWASTPMYDQNKHILHWAKNIKFGTSQENTLNYNIRILGRKGVLILNAVSGMSQLNDVKKQIPSVIDIVNFEDGYKYEQFDSKLDKVAIGGITALVAGKVLAKVGFFGLILKFLAPILKFGKLAIVGIVAAFSFLWRLITGRSKEEEE
jgi:uncharacterized membrane-anchored protein